MRGLILGAVLACGWSGVSQAQTYDAVAQFSTASNPNGVWAYGYGSSPESFTAFTMANSNFGSPSWNLSGLPLIGNAYTGGTVAVPITDLWFHPGDADNLSAIMTFTAPQTASYAFDVFFERADVTENAGDGVLVSLFQNTQLLSQSVLGTTYLNGFSGAGALSLAQGDTLSFVVARRGDYTYDSTGVRATVSTAAVTAPVPEPATWAMMIAGFGAVGFAMRRRNRVTVRTAYMG